MRSLNGAIFLAVLAATLVVLLAKCWPRRRRRAVSPAARSPETPAPEPMPPEESTRPRAATLPGLSPAHPGRGFLHRH